MRVHSDTIATKKTLDVFERTSNSDYAAGTMNVITRDCVKWVFAGQKTAEGAQEW